MIAVELAHDFHHLVDRLEVRPRHGAIGDQQRLVEAAGLDREELPGRVLGMRRSMISRTMARMRFSPTPTCAAISTIDTPRLRYSTMRCSRLNFARTRDGRVH